MVLRVPVSVLVEQGSLVLVEASAYAIVAQVNLLKRQKLFAVFVKLAHLNCCRMFVSLNPAYTIRNDVHCSYIVKIGHLAHNELGSDCVPVPQYIGYILSHIGDDEYNLSCENISVKTGISVTALCHFVEQLVNNEECKDFKVSDSLSVIFPTHLLVKSDTFIKHHFITVEGFDLNETFTIARPSSPLYINLMTTNKCTTECVYCYANKGLTPVLSLSEMSDIIRQCYHIGVVNLTLTGGDLFAFKGWRQLLSILKLYDYKPYISTKTPLEECDISYLLKLGYDEMQFSLDSDDGCVLSELINVREDYLPKVVGMFNICDKLGLKIIIRSVITSKNGSLSQIKQLHNFLSSFKCVREWDITPAFYSQYKSGLYNDYRPYGDQLSAIYGYIHKHSEKFPIKFNKIGERGYELKKHHSVNDFVCYNQVCMANTTTLSILSNGQCSVCEMLYDTDDFLLGNVRNQDLVSIWNSERALRLYAPEQDKINQSSICAKCTVYEKCKLQFGKKVCYVDVIKVGSKPDDPDPRCPMSKNMDVIL